MDKRDQGGKIRSFQEGKERRTAAEKEKQARVEARLKLIQEQTELLERRINELAVELDKERSSLANLNGELRAGREIIDSFIIDDDRLDKFLDRTSELEQ